MLAKRLAVKATPWWIALFTVVWLAAAGGAARADSEQMKLVNKAGTTFSHFMQDPDMTWLQRHISGAKAVLIAPEVLKAGYIFGGSGGRAVVFARNEATGRWVGPAFYNLAAASVGFQAGIALSESVTLVMTEKGLNSLLASTAKLGGDASIAAGPIGAGANSDVTTDFVAFSRAKGVYGGLNLEGSVISVADSWNRSYYGSPVLPPDILVRASARNTQADPLLAALNHAASGQKTSAAQ